VRSQDASTLGKMLKISLYSSKILWFALDGVLALIKELIGHIYHTISMLPIDPSGKCCAHTGEIHLRLFACNTCHFCFSIQFTRFVQRCSPDLPCRILFILALRSSTLLSRMLLSMGPRLSSLHLHPALIFRSGTSYAASSSARGLAPFLSLQSRSSEFWGLFDATLQPANNMRYCPPWRDVPSIGRLKLQCDLSDKRRSCIQKWC
jgi:hypothetical protein